MGVDTMVGIRPPVGALPGTLAVSGDAAPTRVRITDYGPGHCEESQEADPAALDVWMTRKSVTWIDIQGLADLEWIQKFGDKLGIHPLALSDSVNIPQRAKVEEYENYVFFVTHVPFRTEEGLRTEQVSLFLSDQFVLTIQETAEPDCFQVLRERIREARGRIRGQGADYLAYALLDVITDAYFPLLDEIEERIDRIDAEITEGARNDSRREIHRVKRETVQLRRVITQHRDALNTLMNTSAAFLTNEARVYLRDCLDHSIHQADIVVALAELANDVQSLDLSLQSHRMNEVMKVLTVVATIFIPLSFFAGVYGMNFDPAAGPLSMPELRSPLGYLVWWLVMAAMAGSMLLWFRKRGWIWRRKSD